MSKGISHRTSLVLSQSDMQESALLGKRVKQWGDKLPFGAYGFQVQRTTNLTTPIGNTLITFNSVLQNTDSWLINAPSPYGTFIVPNEGSGLYLLSLNVSVAVAIITVNGVAVASSSSPFSIPAWLTDGDVIQARVVSASNTTLVAVAASATIAPSPVFTVVRISLL